MRFSAKNDEILWLYLEENIGSIFREPDRFGRLAYRTMCEYLRIPGERNKLTRNRLVEKYGEGWRYLGGILENLLDDVTQGGSIGEFTRSVVVHLLPNL